MVLPIMSKFLGSEDSYIAIIGTILTMFAYFIMAIAQNSWTGPNEDWDPGWVMFLSATCQWNQVVSVSLNSQLTKIFEKSEFGQILSIVSLVQCFVPLIASPMFGLIYKATLNTFEGMYLLTVVALLPFILGNNLYTFFNQSSQGYEIIPSKEKIKGKNIATG